MAPLTVHHLHISQSERIPWLCEELNIPYELKLYSRAPFLAPPEYKALHPQGTAPIIQDGSLTIAESCACIEYIARKHADGALFLPPTHPDYADFIYWWHWVDGTFQPSVSRAVAAMSGGPGSDTPLAQFSRARFQTALRRLDDRFAARTWLAGEEFTVADIMIVFTLTTFRYWFPFQLGEYGNLVAYLGRIGERESYKAAMAKSDPGMELLLGAEAPAKGLM